MNKFKKSVAALCVTILTILGCAVVEAGAQGSVTAERVCC